MQPSYINEIRLGKISLICSGSGMDSPQNPGLDIVRTGWLRAY
jgi:hypothetical protein